VKWWGGFGRSPILGGIRAITTIGDRLVIAGDFTEAGGVAASCVALWNGSGFEPLGGLNDGSALLVVGADRGGRFSASGSTPVAGVAR
jgi:hypothetical protein